MIFMKKNWQRICGELIAVSSKIPVRISDTIISLEMAFLMLLSPMAVHGIEGLGRWANYKWISAVMMAAAVFLLLRYFEEEERQREIRKALLLTAAFFIIWMRVSEELIGKVRPVYQGVSWHYLFYIASGVIIGASGRSQEKFMENFMRGVGISFVISTIFCFLFRPYTESGYLNGYLGIYPNQNSFGMYLVLVIAAAIWMLHQFLFGKRKENLGVLYYSAEIIVAVFFLIKCGSRASMVNGLFLFLIWGGILLTGRDSIRQKLRKLRRLLVVYAFLLVFLSVSYKFLGDMLVQIPGWVNHPISSEADSYSFETDNAEEMRQGDPVGFTAETDRYRINVRRGAGDDSLLDELFGDGLSFERILSTFQVNGIEELLGERGLIYKYGISHMDMWGHTNGILTVEEGRTYPHMHNNAMQYGYVYGYPCMVSYLLLNLMLLVCFALEKEKGRKEKFGCFLIFAVYNLEYLFEAGGTVVRDTMVVPYFLCVGICMWKVRTSSKEPNKAVDKYSELM